MAYHHILVHRDGSNIRITLLFKDLSEDELRTPFLLRFLNEACCAGEADGIHAPALRARIIRTERPHDAEVDDFLRTYWRQAEEAMRISGQHISPEPVGDSAIAGAGRDITAEFLQSVRPGGA